MNYLSHMQDTASSSSFTRRAAYLASNYAPYLTHVSSVDGSVLDIGPGFGELISVLNQHGLTDIDILDQDQGVLDHCQKNFQIKKVIKTTGGDPSKALKRKYDLITLTQVFEHIPKSSYETWLRGLYKHLKPGGYLVITSPNGANPLVGTERYGDLQHENLFTIYSFQQLMHQLNLKGVSYEIKGFEIPLNSPLNALRRLAQKSLHAFFILLMLVNGAIFQTLLTPNLTLVIRHD